MLVTPTEANNFRFKGKVVHVVDGDTVDIELDLGFSVKLKERFRLYGIDTWETKGEERSRGLIAKEYLKARLEEVSFEVEVQTIKVKERSKRGKFGRYLAVLFIQEVEINSELVDKGHGVFKSY